METRQPELEVRVRKSGELYAWELHFIGHNQAVSIFPTEFVSEADARNAGQKVLGTIMSNENERGQYVVGLVETVMHALKRK